MHCHKRPRLAAVASLLLLVVGCDRGPTLVPVSGKVIYNGTPLRFGSVTFQPSRGQPAIGEIQSDGSFVLGTYRAKDGAVIGLHQVRITCYESQGPPAAEASGERSLGKLLIPLKYTLYDQSGLMADIREEQDEPFVFELTGPPIEAE
jgi:hypothetical protein